ncbi:hypothetical protein [Ornithinimicrobium cerasi]|uniref:hypothetical protein n=1 Tax=Ornithinimicrobium cerasi TaxID=2248773 RepID=UPI000EFF5BEE|nr:hypothetical protein [Ornithinimicrobium cerasi]
MNPVHEAGRERPGGDDRPPRPRRHRRVTAPATNADADPTDDAMGQEGSGAASSDPDGGAGRAGLDGTGDGRDAWIREQRPPHWD